MPNFIEIGGGSRKFSKKLVDLTRNDPILKSGLSITQFSLQTAFLSLEGVVQCADENRGVRELRYIQ